MIDRHTKLLLDELSVIKSNHLKEMEIGMEEIDRYCTIFTSFEAYCTELNLNGSPSDICSSIDQIILRADELEKDHEAFIGRLRKSVEVSFQTTDFGYVLQNTNNNFVGKVEGRLTCLVECYWGPLTKLVFFNGQISPSLFDPGYSTTDKSATIFTITCYSVTGTHEIV